MLAIRMGLSRSGQVVVRASEAKCWANKQQRRSDRNPPARAIRPEGLFCLGAWQAWQWLLVDGLGWLAVQFSGHAVGSFWSSAVAMASPQRVHSAGTAPIIAKHWHHQRRWTRRPPANPVTFIHHKNGPQGWAASQSLAAKTWKSRKPVLASILSRWGAPSHCCSHTNLALASSPSPDGLLLGRQNSCDGANGPLTYPGTLVVDGTVSHAVN